MSDDEQLPSSDGPEEDFSKYETDKGTRLRWLKEIDTVKNSKSRRMFERIGERIVKIYRNQLALDGSLRSNTQSISQVTFNILWSNTQILKPALFARLPKVVVDRRFKDDDPIGRMAAQIAERSITFVLDANKDRYFWAIKQAVEDRLLPGLGTVWPRYDCEIDDLVGPDGLPIMGPDGKPVQGPVVSSEEVVWDYIFWQDYFWSACRNPYEKRWEAKRVYMTRKELISAFGKVIGKACKLDHNPNSNRSKLSDEDAQFLGQAVVYEIHEKDSKLIFWVSTGYEAGCLKVQQDVLNLKGFFNCPIPLLATTTTDSMYPTPDYVIYEALADELERVTERIRNITECIRLVGATSAAVYKELKNVLKLKDGDLFPVESWSAFVDKGGFKGVIDWVPFDMAVAALQPLLAQQQNVMALIDLITGIPDLVHGATDPSETASAIQKKSHWMTLKMSDRQSDVQRFCRDLIGKTGEIIFEPGLYSDQTIALMCGAAQMSLEDQAIYPQGLALLRQDRLNTFRIDIETDSTLAEDMQDEQQAWATYMQTLQASVQEIEAISQFQPELLHPIIESAKAAVRSLRTGRSVEGAWDSAWSQIETRIKAQAAQPPTPPAPDPALIRAQNDTQRLGMEQQQAQTDAQSQAQKAQDDKDKEGFETWKWQQEFALKQQAQSAAERNDELTGAVNQAKVEILGESAQTKAKIDTLLASLESQALELDKLKVVMGAHQNTVDNARGINQDRHTAGIEVGQHINDSVSAHAGALKTHAEASKVLHDINNPPPAPTQK